MQNQSSALEAGYSRHRVLFSDPIERTFSSLGNFKKNFLLLPFAILAKFSLGSILSVPDQAGGPLSMDLRDRNDSSTSDYWKMKTRSTNSASYCGFICESVNCISSHSSP